MQTEIDETMPLRTSDDVVRVRQAVRARAVAAGFSLVDQTKIVTAASEIGRNTVDYGGGGTLRIEVLRNGRRRGVRLTFEDQGPGIADLALALKDGYTTGGGPGPRPQRRQAAVQRVRYHDPRRDRAPSSRWRVGPRMFTAVADASQVAEARRLVGDLARRIGLPPARIDQVAIVVTELATNLLKHGGGGHIHAGRCDDAEGTGLELLALDRGSGMADPDRCMQDGYSTAGSPGNGPRRGRAPRRHGADLHPPGAGLRVMARFVERPRPRRPDRCSAPRLRPIRANRSAATTGRGATPRPAARSCWSTARATASRRHAPRRPPCGRSRKTPMRLRGHRRADPSRAGADPRRRAGGRTHRRRGARRPLRRARQYQRDAGQRGQGAAHGLAQRHGGARRAAHPRVHL